MNANDRVPHSRRSLSVVQIPSAPLTPQPHARLNAAKHAVKQVSSIFRDLGRSYFAPFGRVLGIDAVEDRRPFNPQTSNPQGYAHAPNTVAYVPDLRHLDAETEPLLPTHSNSSPWSPPFY